MLRASPLFPLSFPLSLPSSLGNVASAALVPCKSFRDVTRGEVCSDDRVEPGGKGVGVEETIGLVRWLERSLVEA